MNDWTQEGNDLNDFNDFNDLISISLIDKYQKEVAAMKHTYDPNDILVRKCSGEPTRHTYLNRGGEPAIDVAILAEGYRADDMELFIQDAQKVVDAIFRPLYDNAVIGKGS